MYSRVETITPEIAAMYLKKNSKHNRPLSSSWARVLANKMKRGEWQLSAQGLIFNESGELIDGQSRLEGVVKSGCTVEMYVTYDAPDNIWILDRGKKRTIRDSLNMAGVNAQHNEIAAINFMFRYVGEDFSQNEAAVLRFFQDHADTIRDALDLTANGSVKNAILTRQGAYIAAVWSALIDTGERQKIKRFCAIVNNGLYDNESETAAIVERNYILNSIIRPNKKQEVNTLFRITQTAIKNFLDEKPSRYVWRDPKACYFDGKQAERIIREVLKG